jgi:drug/metabolite transporter (DMT)-like permease
MKIQPGHQVNTKLQKMLNEKVKTIIAFSAIYFVWGATFLGVSIALKSFPPFILCGLRFLIGGLALLFYCYSKKEALPGRPEIIHFSLWGIVIFGGGVVAVVWAQQYLPSLLASTILTTPFWFILLDKSQWHINFKSGWIIMGLIAGLSGVILLLTQRQSARLDPISFIQVKATLVIIAGSFLWVSGSLRLKNSQYKTTVYAKTSIHLLAASAFSFLISIASKEYKIMHINNLRTDSLISMLSLSLLSTTATFLAFIWLINKKPVAIVSTYAYINPLVAVVLGVFIGKESFTGLQAIAMLIILAGVLFVNIPKYKI